MAHGDLAHDRAVEQTARSGRHEDSATHGEVVTPTGRVSIARRVLPEGPSLPFSRVQLGQLDEALTFSSRLTGLEFSIYLGDLGEDTRERAEQLHAGLAEKADGGVLIAVSPGQRKAEIVTGHEAHRRLPDRGCKLAMMSMVASFKEGDLVAGLLSGLRMLADQAGSPSH